MGLDIRRCTVDELAKAPNLLALLAEYAEEGALAELGPANHQEHLYRILEQSNILFPIAAFDENNLVGFILPVVCILPHYGVLAATIESYFVEKAARKRGVGLKLLRFAENVCRELGAKAVLLSAPFGGTLARIAPRVGYRPSNDVFIRGLA